MVNAVEHLKLPTQLAGLILQVLEEQGVAASKLLKGTHLNRELLQSGDNDISFKAMLGLIEQTIALSPTPDIGLRIGRRENISTWGMLGYAIMSCATEWEATQIGIQYYQAGPSMMAWSARREDELVRLRLDSIGPMGNTLRFCVEENFAGHCAVSSELMNRKIRPIEMRLSYSPPDYADAYREYFECPVHFDQAENSVLMNIATNRPLKNADPASAALCLKLVEGLVKRYAGEEDLIFRIRKILLRSPGAFPSMEDVASELSLSSRTLRRQLADLDTSFAAVLTEVQKNLAIDYLTNSSLNVDQIGALLGYSETTNFRRAFKQWTGNPPTFYRASKGL